MENADDACRPDNFHSQQLTFSTLVRKYQCLLFFLPFYIILPIPPPPPHPPITILHVASGRRCSGRRLRHLAVPPERHAVVTSRYRQRSKESAAH